nr:DUF6020 family protein [Lachnospiraceae bacterium]
IVVRYPAGIETDAYLQISDFLEGTMTAHWPPASSAYMGSFVWLGIRLLGSADLGIFSYCLVQIILGSLVFSLSLTVMEEYGVPLFWRRLSLLVYALVPIYPGYISSVVKDGPYAVAVLLYILLVARMILKEGVRIGQTLTLTLVGILVCILRNNGIYLVGAILAALLIASIVRRRPVHPNVSVSALAAAAFSMVYFYALIPALGIPSGSVAEALSMPFQQTARLAAYHPEAMTDAEKDVIGEVLDLGVIERDYDPVNVDPIKATYHGDTGALIRYFGVWLGEGVRRPDVYLDAFLVNSSGFYYPDIRLSNSNVVSGIYSSIQNTRSVRFTDRGEDTRVAFRTFFSFVEGIPFVFPFVNIAIQLWIPVYLAIYALAAGKRRLLFLVIPSVIGMLVCLASPYYANNGARYAIPVVYANLFLLGIRVKDVVAGPCPAGLADE